MLLIPYILKNKKKSFIGFELYEALLFLQEKGNKVWEIDSQDSYKSIDTIVKEYLTDNGFIGSVTCVKDETIYFQIDSDKINLKDFYTYLDSVDESFDVWRSFFHIEGKDWAWDEQEKNLTLKKFGPISKFWKTIL